jgi:hypothetical protein
VINLILLEGPKAFQGGFSAKTGQLKSTRYTLDLSPLMASKIKKA